MHSKPPVELGKSSLGFRMDARSSWLQDLLRVAVAHGVLHCSFPFPVFDLRSKQAE